MLPAPSTPPSVPVSSSASSSSLSPPPSTTTTATPITTFPVSSPSNVPPLTPTRRAGKLLDFNVLVYNMWFMPPLVSGLGKMLLNLNVSPRKRTRAAAIFENIYNLDKLQGVDAIVVCEGFCRKTMRYLRSLLRSIDFQYHTHILGSKFEFATWNRVMNGGVTIISRYPILSTREVTFGPRFEGGDGWANKGVIRATIQKGETIFHVYGTHLQAWDNEKCAQVRAEQMAVIREMVKEDTEAGVVSLRGDFVIVCGDFNIPKHHAAQYSAMLDTLSCRDAGAPGFGTGIDDTRWHRRSFDAKTNALARSGPSANPNGESEHVDYVLFSRVHRLPVSHRCSVLKFKAFCKFPVHHNGIVTHHEDLSDHYPVFAEFKYESERSGGSSKRLIASGSGGFSGDVAEVVVEPREEEDSSPQQQQPEPEEELEETEDEDDEEE